MPRRYLHLLRWLVLRYLSQHRLLAALNIGSVALGVAVYLSIQIANHSANRAFAATVDVVAGKAHLQITAPARGLPDDIFPLVSRQPGIAAATPLVRGLITLVDFPGEYLELLGIDVFTNAPFRTFEVTGFETSGFNVQRWLGRNDSIAVSEEFAESHRLSEGDSIRVQVHGTTRMLRIDFILRGRGSSTLGPQFAAMDIGWAQEFFNCRGTLNAVHLRLSDPGAREKIVANLKSLLPSDFLIVSPIQRGEQVEKMLSSFQLNLTAMSLVSVLVGIFLIYNTVSASVARRRHEIGILRSLGTTRREVHTLFLLEAFVLGTIGSAIGIFGGTLLARVLVQTVSETISTLYVLVEVRRIWIAPWMYWAAFGIGLASVLFGAWFPARDAARMDPIRALSGDAISEFSERHSRAWIWCGAAFLLISGAFAWLALATGPAWLGFVAAFFVLAGFSFFAPVITAIFSNAIAQISRWNGKRGHKLFIEINLAATNLSRALRRNSVTIAAVACAIAMTVSVGVMVFSFRQTVTAWIDETLTADLFIAPASNAITGPTSFMPPDATGFLEALPGVEAVDTFRGVALPLGDETIAVAVNRGTERRRLNFLRGDSASILRRFYNEQCVLVSESFARRHRVEEGSDLELPTPMGKKRFPIAGVFYDYTRDRGVVYLSEKNFVRFWNDDRINSIAVYLRENENGTAVANAFRAKFSPSGEFAFFANRDLRTRVFQIFDQTFAVTYVLRTIAVIVAIAGIFFTLSTLVIERTRELAILRSLGASAAQIRRLLLWESGMIGVVASLLGLAAGIFLSFVLTGVINRAFFGWTIRMAFPWVSLALTPAWIVAAALAAGWLPAFRAGRMPIAEAVRNE